RRRGRGSARRDGHPVRPDPSRGARRALVRNGRVLVATHRPSRHPSRGLAGRAGDLMRAIARSAVMLALAGWLAACSTAPPTGEARNAMVEQASATLRDMTREDPSLDEMVRKSYGYALFPEVTKGGLVFGGAYGRGVVYEQGQLAGYADLTAGSFGLQ